LFFARMMGTLSGLVGGSATSDANIRSLVASGSALPSFFVIGPPRTGTSWLHQVLKDHAVLPRSTKETHFFDKHFHRGLAWYRGHYDVPTRTAARIGEVAPTYFASNAARDRIARLVPNAKVVCIFRSPLERLLSLYRLKSAYGVIRWSLEQALERDPELLESSLYATKLKGWHQALSPEQVLVTFYDDLRDRPQSFVNTLADFLGLPRFALRPTDAKYVNASGGMTYPRHYYFARMATVMASWCKSQRFNRVVTAAKTSSFPKLFMGGGQPFAEMSPEMSFKLSEILRPEMEELEVMLNRDLGAWKAPVQQLVA
jgi:Sulfotransferase domain